VSVRAAVILDLAAVSVPFRAAELFGEPRALEVEIGVGKGLFLLEWASANPERGLIGVERVSKYLTMAGNRALRAGLANVRLVHTTAEDLLFRCLEPASVTGIHVYFPDPWPKKRHHKRRFFRPPNVARLAEVMQPGGLLRVKTDHDEYAEVIASVLAAEPRFEGVDVDEAFSAIPETHFEIKYARLGRVFHRLAARRRQEEP
jgi:tRNA (guanine-N7-)-methyltransferase